MVKISIVIPVFNRRDIVDRTLASIAAQSSRDFELILVDNNSTDGSIETLYKWRENMSGSGIGVKILSCTVPGASAARNAGLAAATAQWVMFFDSDDTMRQRHIERVTDAIDRHPESDIIGWNILLHNGDKTSVKPFTPIDIVRKNIFEASMAPQRYCVRRDLARKAGGWNEKIMRWNDIEFGQRLLALNPRCVFAGNEITVDVYAGDDSITGKSFAADADKLNLSLDTIKAAMPDSDKFVLEVKRAITAGLCSREDSPTGKKMFLRALNATTGTGRRMTLRFAYHYTRLGLRGAARILFTTGLI